MRRANGTGTITKLSGNRRRPYMVRIASRDKWGRVIQTPLSYHASLREAQEALDNFNLMREAGKAPASDYLSMTVEQVYEAWSQREYVKMGESSIANYRAAWNKRVSRFAKQKLREMTLDQWQGLLDEDEDNGCSQSVINCDAALIRFLYRYGIQRDIVTKDYSAYLEIPTVNPKVLRGALTDIQMAKLEDMAAEKVPWADTVLMLCYTGFRIGEFLELTRFNYHAEDGGYLQGGKKTRAGKDRIVPVHPKIAPYLLERLAEGENYIISVDGKPVSQKWYREKAFAPIVEALGIPEATPHWCRHTFATRLHAAGADPLTTKWLLGHSTENDITHHYTHETMSLLVREIQKLA